jgi:DHA1 family multidrug resistance protein-like MFS transporter
VRGAESTSRWQLLVGLFLLTGLVETIGFSHYLTYNFSLLEGFGLEPTAVRQWVGILGSLSFLLGLPLAPFWGTWADRYSRKLIITRSALVEAAFFTLIGLSRDLPQLLASASLAGLVLGNTGVMFAVLSETAPRHRVGLALAITGAAGPLGFAVGPLLGGLLINGFTLGGWTFAGLSLRSLLIGDGILSLVMGLAVITLFREAPRPRTTGGSVLAQVRAAIGLVPRSPVLRSLFLVAVLGYVGQRLSTAYMPLFIKQLYGGADLERVIGLIVGTGSAALGLLAPVWGLAGDRAGHARLFAAPIAGAALGLAVLAMAHTLEQVTVAWVVLGCLQAGINPLFYTLVATRTPEGQRSTVLAFSYVPLYIGGLIGPGLGALLAGWGVPTQGLFLLGAIALASGAAVAWGLRHAPAAPAAQIMADPPQSPQTPDPTA